VNEALLFRHFPTKEDLYAAILQRKSDQNPTAEMLAALEEHAARRDDSGYFRTFAERFLDSLNEQPEFMRLILFSALERHELADSFREKHAKPLYEALARYISLRQREGAFREMRPAVLVRALVGMIAHHVLTVEIFGVTQPRISKREAVVAFTSIFIAGLKCSPDDAT